MGVISLLVFRTHEVLHIAVPECLRGFMLKHLHEFQRIFTARSQLAELGEPWTQLVEQPSVGQSLFQLCRHLLYLFELTHEVIILFWGVMVKAEGCCFPRFVTPITRFCVGRMDGKGSIRVLCLRCHHRQSALPTVQCVIGCGVPGVVSNAVHGKFRGLTMLHGVAQQTGHLACGDGVFQSIDGSLQHDVAHIVGHGIVPPKESRPLDA